MRSTDRPPGPSRWIIPMATVAVVLVLIVFAVWVTPRGKPPETTFTAVNIPSITPRPTRPVITPPTGVLSETDPEELDKLNEFFGELPTPEVLTPLTSKKVKGVYVPIDQSIEPAIELYKAGHINAVVIDFKERGGIFYRSKDPELQRVYMGTDHVSKQLNRLKEEGVYVIARIVCFADAKMASAHPERAISDQAENVLTYPGEGSSSFLNPYDTRNWDDLIKIALEAVVMGANEIQFDYVRFPTGRSTSGERAYFGNPDDLPSRPQAINRFLETARVKIQDTYGIPVGADVFSIVIMSQLDGNTLGQDWPTIGRTGIASLSPMVYPSHYANSSNHYSGNGQGTILGGTLFEKPDLHPYDVTRLALIDGLPVTMAKEYTTVRPFLQAFTANYLPSGYFMEYDAAAIAQTIAAVYAAGYDEWLLWSPNAEYPAEIFTDESLQVPQGTDEAPPEP